MRGKDINSYIHLFEGDKPILLEMPHSGTMGLNPEDVPESIRSKFKFGSQVLEKTFASGCDVSVPDMTGFYDLVTEVGLYGICNDLGRIFCDTNRNLNEVSGWALKDKTYRDYHHGLIWTRDILTDVDLSLSQKDLELLVIRISQHILSSPLTKDEFDQLMLEVYVPYHQTIQKLHKKLVHKYGYCIHLALHSLPPLSVRKVCGGYVNGQKAARGPFNIQDNTLPDLILIHNDFKATDPMIVDQIRKPFQDNGLIVEDGQGPFVGDVGVTAQYGNPDEGVHIIGLEHVAHDTEPSRHKGLLHINITKAERFQPYYRQAVLNLF